ncbi:50S ribosome-binding GTPase [Nocardioides sp. J9]|uniref:GTPase n=1 Tax=unclassified Nocardioides TaxID=2615069 RepID=UPI0004B505A2|nr:MULTISPECIES: GTPase [unclassified Nocardioides]TWG97434.1 50S ribosome-binding GTPase [Nocardioides sp. J9]
MTNGLDTDTTLGDLATRGTPVGERLQGLGDAVVAARGHVPDELLDEVASAADRATGRLRLSARHTVVAIAGATGSGKSSTYNALTGLELSSVGVRRPTTSWATAVVWGSEGADELLDWIGIPPRHQTMRDSMLDTRHTDSALDGVVLLDLPDHDSTEVSHHLEVDRLVAVADLMVWILDPQKYADAAVHDRYFKKLTSHQGVMLVALNHIDTVPVERRQAMVDDVRRLLAEDGLPDVQVLAISAKQGIGMDELRAEIRRRVQDKRSTTARVEADIAAAAARLEAAAGDTPARELPAKRYDELEDSVADAAGVSAVVDSIERTVGERARRAVAWPPFLLLGRKADGDQPRHEPEVAPVDRSSVDTAVRGVADEASEGVGAGWAPHVRKAATGRLAEVSDRLDRELGRVDLPTRLPFWLVLVRVLHGLLLLAAVGGLGWWAYAAISGESADLTEVAGLPLPAVIGIGGLVLGLLLAVVGRAVVGGLARRRAEDADEELRSVVHQVVHEDVVAPLAEELSAYATFRRGISAARA